jgi:ectoine hydroxylase-related dioxygenase (phytanoyl-CoA dioxygenase family)
MLKNNPLTTLSETDVQNYYQQGYLMAPGLVASDAVEAVMERVGDTPTQAGGDWKPLVCKEPTREDQPVHRLLVEPNLLAAVERLLEAPARVFHGMVAIVPPHGGRGLPWHQDNMYNQILGRALNAFIALRRITPEMGGLWIAPESHKLGVVSSHQWKPTAGHRQADVEPEEAIQLPTMEPGDVCFFTRTTLHRSLQNSTDTPRFAYSAQYCEAKGRYSKDGTTVERPLAEDLIRLWA